jgi:hypothetical protein
MAVFWGVAPCSLVDIDRRFRRHYCFHYQGVITVLYYSSGQEFPVLTDVESKLPYSQKPAIGRYLKLV